MDIMGHSFDMGDNFVNIHPKCTFSEFAQAFCKQLLKVQMDDQVYMHLQIVKHNLNERVEEYYEWIFTLANSFKHLADDQLLNAFFRAILLLYLWVTTINMEWGTLIQHFEFAMICEENSINVDGNWVILNVYPMMKREKKKVENPIANTSKSREKECQYCKKTNHWERSVFGTLITWKTNKK